jgi:hypothetical protein
VRVERDIDAQFRPLEGERPRDQAVGERSHLDILPGESLSRPRFLDNASVSARAKRGSDVDMDSWHRCRFGLLVSWIVAGNDRTRTLTGIRTSWTRRSGRQFTSTRRRGIY